MEAGDGELRRLRFTYRGEQFSLAIDASSSLRELGEELRSATGISPQTMRLLVSRGGGRPAAALEPFKDECGLLPVRDCGIEEGKIVRLMGALPQELVEMSQGLQGDSTRLGFEEEEERALRRSFPAAASTRSQLPSGNYVFQSFRTLQLPGVEMTPPPSEALKLLHALASDRGIVAVMNKYRWRVGILTEMAPEGLVGISPKCLLGFNKNRGEEISLRLRTDDLKGFRKYDSIRKTLLHELAHMVHDEHDENFHQLDKLLNKESIELDWTRSRGKSLSGMKHQAGEHRIPLPEISHNAYRLGGDLTSASLNVKIAAANAAFNRLNASLAEALNHEEPDPDDRLEALGSSKFGGEPDPDEGQTYGKEPDPDEGEACERKQEPDPDDEETCEKSQEPDPDEFKDEPKVAEPDPDENELMEDEAEPDPDDQDPDELEDDKKQKLLDMSEPDPDEELGSRSRDEGENLDDKMEVDDLDEELRRINDAAAATSSRLEKLIGMLARQASPEEATLAFQTLMKILSNIMEHPNEEKYRRIKKDNRVFQERVAKFTGAIELLKIVGFTEEAAMSSLVLKNNDPGLLWLAKSLVTTALSSYVHG